MKTTSFGVMFRHHSNDQVKGYVLHIMCTEWNITEYNSYLLQLDQISDVLINIIEQEPGHNIPDCLVIGYAIDVLFPEVSTI